MAKLASLIVDLKADNAQLKHALDGVQKQLGGLQQKVSSVGKMFTVALGAKVFKDGISALGRLITTGAQAADRMGKLAQSVGAPVEALSRLNYAARLSNLTTDQLGSSMGRLAKQMAEAAGGSKQQMRLFEVLGVKVKDANGNLRTTDQVLLDVAEAFAGMEDGAGKAALAQELFGKSGAQLIPYLNQGKEGLKALGLEADKFGQVVTDKSAKAAADFNDALEKMKMLSEGVALKVAENLTPSLTDLSNQLSKDSTALEDVSNVITGIAKALMTAAAGILLVADIFGKTIGFIGAAAAHVSELFDDQKVGSAQAWRERGHELAAAFEEGIGKSISGFGDRTKALWNPSTGSSPLVPDDMITPLTGKPKRKAPLMGEGPIMKMKGIEISEDDVRLLRLRDMLEERSQYGEITKINGLDPGVAHADTGPGTLAKSQRERSASMYDMWASDQRSIITNIKKNLKNLGAGVADAMKAAADSLGRGTMHGVQLMNSKLGDLGAMFGTAIEGFEAGGIWGAVMAVIVDLVSRLEKFIEIVQVADGIVFQLLEQLGPSLEMLITALKPLLGAVGILVQIVGAALGPVISSLAGALEALAPTLVIVGYLLSAVLQPVALLLAIVLKGLAWVFKEVLFPVIKYVTLGILYVLKGIAMVWNGIVDAVTGIIMGLRNALATAAAALSINIDGVLKELSNWAVGVSKMKATTGNLDKQIEDLNNATFETAGGMADAAAASYQAAGAQKEQTKAVTEATRAWLNVPQGLKVNFHRFESMTPMADGGVVTRPLNALIGEAGPEAVIPLGQAGGIGGTFYVTIKSDDPDRIWERIKRLMERDNYRQKGTILGLTPRTAGG